MGVEGREIPTGYKTVKLEGINATGIMPETWFFRTDQLSGTRAFFMTREQITLDNMFTTGMSINVVPKIAQKTNILPSRFAREYIEREPMNPIGGLEENTKGSLTSYRQLFSHNGGFEDGHLMEPTMMSVFVAGDDRRDRVYLGLFETPENQWEQDREIAGKMITGLIFDSRIR